MKRLPWLRGVSTRAPLLCLFAVGCVASLVPLSPLRGPEEMTEMVRGFLAFAIAPPPLWTITERVVLIAPLGILAAGQFRSVTPGRVAAIGAAAAVTLAFGLEILQLPVEGRHPRFSDALIATWAFGFGFALRLAWRPGGTMPLIAHLTAQFALLSLLILVSVASAPSLDPWACRFPILLGDEADGGRSWRGTLSGFALFARALPPDEVARLAKGDEPAAPPLLVRPDPVRLTGAGEVLADPGEAEAICRTIKASGALTVLVTVRSAGIRQDGPARIATMSGNPLRRNFTIGQEGSRFIVRLRTASSGLNGEGFSLWTDVRTVAKRPQHIAFTYGDGVGRLYVDGRLAARPRHFDRLFRSRFWSSAGEATVLLALAGGLVACGLHAARISPAFRTRG